MVLFGIDIGFYICEKMLLEKYLNYYKDILSEIENVCFFIILCKRNGYKDNDGFFDRMVEIIKFIFFNIELLIYNDDVDNNYYKGINFKILVK